ncbi:hypothetical protein [Bacillus tuaregi]|uniref:hypothetical protein n=1 Tax=Bacillus tuaregi TaxID=1816695 RepID=UPI0008F89B46|nr:hypothetical protein [Bacillus tuaregi]
MKKRLLVLLLSMAVLFSLSGCSEISNYVDSEGCTVVKVKKKVLWWVTEKDVQKTCPQKENPTNPVEKDPEKDINKEFDGDITLPENKGNPNAGLNGQLEIDSWRFDTE